MSIFSFFFTQKSRRQAFREVVRAVVDVVRSKPTSVDSQEFVRTLVEGLFLYFFSKHRISLKNEDCRGFLALANEQTGFTAAIQGSHSWDSCLCSCTSFNVFKFYLIAILGKSKEGTPLGLHTPEVRKHYLSLLVYNNTSRILQRRELVGSVLMAAEPKGTPAPYIPLCYQIEGVQSCQASKVCLEV